MPIETKADARLIAALDFLQANAERIVTVRQLATVAGLSEARFSHLFALRTGMTPGEYLRFRGHLQDENRLAKSIIEQSQEGPRLVATWRDRTSQRKGLAVHTLWR